MENFMIQEQQIKPRQENEHIMPRLYRGFIMNFIIIERDLF